MANNLSQVRALVCGAEGKAKPHQVACHSKGDVLQLSPRKSNKATVEYRRAGLRSQARHEQHGALDVVACNVARFALLFPCDVPAKRAAGHIPESSQGS